MADEPQQGQPQQGWLPPGSQPTQPGWQPPAAPYGGYGQGYGQYGYPQQPYGGPWGPLPYFGPPEPNNSPAVTGFVMAVASIAVLVLFFGLLSPITLIVSFVSIFVSRAGIKKVERGETTRNRDLAKWGFWLGIVGTVLSALALAAWIVAIVEGAFDDDGSGLGEPARILASLLG